MNRGSAVLSMLLALSIVLTAAAPVALAEDAPPMPGAVITWTPPALLVAVAPGETQHAGASFVSDSAIADARLLVSFPLSRYVQVSPQGPLQVAAGTEYAVDLTITVPEQGAPFILAGMVQVMGQRRAYAAPLIVTLTRVNPNPPVHWTPDAVRLWVDPPAVAAETTTPVSTTEVSFTTAVTITGAQIRATPPLSNVLELSEHGPITLTPGITYTLVMTAHQPLATTSLDASERSTARRIVSGLVQVFDPDKVYPHNLPVSVVLGPRPVPAIITWRPPVVTLLMTPTQTITRVVTMMSNVTVTNASLSVTGAITPYVTLSSSEPAPLTIRPRTAYPITLTVTSPVSPTLYRPCMGAVVVTDGSGHAYRFDLKIMLMWRRAGPAAGEPGS